MRKQKTGWFILRRKYQHIRRDPTVLTVTHCSFAVLEPTSNCSAILTHVASLLFDNTDLSDLILICELSSALLLSVEIPTCHRQFPMVRPTEMLLGVAKQTPCLCFSVGHCGEVVHKSQANLQFTGPEEHLHWGGFGWAVGDPWWDAVLSV